MKRWLILIVTVAIRNFRKGGSNAIEERLVEMSDLKMDRKKVRKPVIRKEEWANPENFSIEEIDETLVIGMTFRFADSKQQYQVIAFAEDEVDVPVLIFDKASQWDDQLRSCGCAHPDNYFRDDQYIEVVDFAAMIKRWEVVDCSYCEYWYEEERYVWTADLEDQDLA